MIIKNKLIIIFAVSLLILSSCKEDDFLRETPRDAIYAENLYTSYSGFQGGMNAVPPEDDATETE